MEKDNKVTETKIDCTAIDIPQTEIHGLDTLVMEDLQVSHIGQSNDVDL